MYRFEPVVEPTRQPWFPDPQLFTSAFIILVWSDKTYGIRSFGKHQEDLMYPWTAALAAAGMPCCALAGCSMNVGGTNVPTFAKAALEEDISERLTEAGERPEWSRDCSPTRADSKCSRSAVNRAWRASHVRRHIVTSTQEGCGCGAPPRCRTSTA